MPNPAAQNSMKPLKQAIILVYALGFFLLAPSTSPAGKIDDLVSKAEMGQVEAQLQLGDAYYAGKGTRKDMEQAFLWYTQAAEQGHPKAQRALGAMYELGKGTDREPEKAAYWYRKAAEQGLARAQTNLAILYETGTGVQQNYDEARLWYEKAAAQDYARGQTYLGRIYELGLGVAVDFTKAFYWYRKAAEQGYARAQTNLGALYEAGQGVERNYEEAVAWYAKAAEQMYSRGQFYLGRMFEQGLGVAKDLNQASDWYSKAAALGNVAAREQLARMKREDDKTDKKIKEGKQESASPAPEERISDAAGKKEEKEAKQVTAPAKDTYPAPGEIEDPGDQNRLGLLYLNGGEGYDRDAGKAAYWFRRAAENGNVAAQNNLAFLYLNGQGVEKDFQEAALWLHRAAEAGNADAQRNLGLIYYYGEGVEQDYQQAVFWFLKAAKQGYVLAQNNLAVMYAEGLGVEKNMERAIYWLQNAADQGDLTARNNLAMLIVDKPEATASSVFPNNSPGSVSLSPAAENTDGEPAGISVPEPKPDFISRQAAKEHFSKGNQFAKDGQFDSAISEYNTAVALDPENSNTYENLAISYAKTGNFPDAVQTMQTAIRLSPDDAMKYSTLGIIYHADGKLQRALEQYIRSVRLNPGYGEMYYNMAVIYNELGQFESAYRAGLQAQSLGYAGSSQFLLELNENNPELSELPENKNTVHLRHIVTSTAEEAELVLKVLQEGDDFIQLAAQFSLAPFNLNGGYIGLFAPNELIPAISEVLVPLSPLTFSPVIETNSGFHIFQKFLIDANLPPSR